MKKCFNSHFNASTITSITETSPWINQVTLLHILSFAFDDKKKKGKPVNVSTWINLFHSSIQLKQFTVNHNQIFIFHLERAFTHGPLGKSILSLKLISAYIITDCVIRGSKMLSSLPLLRKQVFIFHGQSSCQIF